MKKQGFTLIEILVYVTVLVVVLIIVVAFLNWSIRTNAKTKVTVETLNSTKRMMEIMDYEIRESKSIYTPTSVFGTNPGQLSLETTKHLPPGETNTFIDFYLCGTQLCLKTESQDPIALNAPNIKIDSLVFTEVISNDRSSVQIDLVASYNNPSDILEYQSTINLKSAVSPRSY